MIASRYYILAGVSAFMLLMIVIFLAQLQIIVIPYLTPTILEVQGLRDSYSIDDRAALFNITLKGYGSNCHMLEVEAIGQGGERSSYYRKADDCRFMTIMQGPYNFTKSIDYGNEVLGKQGSYKLHIQFEDLVNHNKAAATKSFTVNTR